MRNQPRSDEAGLPDESVDARIRRAEAAIAGLKANFVGWVKADIDSIGVHLAQAQSACDPALRAEHLEALRRVAHNIKGQGGTFGCHGLSEAAAELDILLKRQSDAAAAAAAACLVAKLRDAFARELA